MRRGDIRTVSGGKDDARKPRPVVIVQDDSFDATDSIMICAFTTNPTEAPLFRLLVEPNERDGCASLPADGGQDHHRPEVQGRREDRAAGRRGRGPAQPGRDGVRRPGGVAENGPERGMMGSPATKVNSGAAKTWAILPVRRPRDTAEMPRPSSTEGRSDPSASASTLSN